MLTAFAAMETVHVWAYSHLNDTLGLPDVEYKAFREYEAMKNKYEYLQNLKIDTEEDIAYNLACFGGFMEGVSLFASFAILMNFPRRGLLKNVGQIITWSIRDESLHSEGVCALFREYISERPYLWTEDFRDKLFNVINKDSDQFLFSYRSLGHTLPGDIETAEWQRHFNPDWYNNTYFSIVAETVVDHTLPLFITEKTFKPIAFQHPFIILGQPNVLRWLRYLGFETFDNLFDESYDTVSNVDNKLEIIDKNIFNFAKTPYDVLTEQKIAHNHNLFFDQTQVLDRIQQEIINPILNYAET
jgi:hypothetical protein